MSSIFLKNPHSVAAAIAARPRDVLQVSLPPSVRAGAAEPGGWAEVGRLASAQGIRVHSTAPGRSDPARGGGPSAGRGPARHPRGGTDRPEKSEGRESFGEAEVRPRTGIALEELFSGARERADGGGIWLALDSLQDPHNVGAIFRAASFFGVQGILMTEERSAPLTGTVYDVASGGVEDVPFTQQTNLQRAFEVAKDAGLWILGTSEHAKESLYGIKRDRPWLVVVGNEERGMRRLTQERCDVLCGVPSVGRVTSLNAAVAAGIVISTLTHAPTGG